MVSHPAPVTRRSNALPLVLDALAARFGDRLSTANVVREHHGKGESWHPVALPDGVCFVQSTEEVAEVALRLHPQPETIIAAVVDFPLVDTAVRTVIETIQHGLPMARIELVDTACIRAINAYSNTRWVERDHLFLEFHGSAVTVAEQVQLFESIGAEQGGSELKMAQHEEDRNRLWQA